MIYIQYIALTTKSASDHLVPQFEMSCKSGRIVREQGIKLESRFEADPDVTGSRFDAVDGTTK